VRGRASLGVGIKAFESKLADPARKPLEPSLGTISSLLIGQVPTLDPAESLPKTRSGSRDPGVVLASRALKRMRRARGGVTPGKGLLKDPGAEAMARLDRLSDQVSAARAGDVPSNKRHQQRQGRPANHCHRDEAPPRFKAQFML